MNSMRPRTSFSPCVHAQRQTQRGDSLKSLLHSKRTYSVVCHSAYRNSKKYIYIFILIMVIIVHSVIYCMSLVYVPGRLPSQSTPCLWWGWSSTLPHSIWDTSGWSSSPLELSGILLFPSFSYVLFLAGPQNANTDRGRKSGTGFNMNYSRAGAGGWTLGCVEARQHGETQRANMQASRSWTRRRTWVRRDHKNHLNFLDAWTQSRESYYHLVRWTFQQLGTAALLLQVPVINPHLKSHFKRLPFTYSVDRVSFTVFFSPF